MEGEWCLNSDQALVFEEACIALGCSSGYCGASTSSCDPIAASNCATAVSVCIGASSTLASQCDCFAPYETCLIDAGCLDASSYSQFVTQCEISGCTAEQCSSASFITPLCNLTLSAACDTTYTSCTGSSCACEQQQAECYLGAGCYDLAFQEKCLGPSACSDSTCNFLTDTCDTNATLACVNSAVQCYNATSSQSGTCSCVIAYTHCMTVNAGCSGEVLSALVSGCTSLGCDSTQCTNAGVTGSATGNSGATGGVTGGATGGATGGVTGGSSGHSGSGGHSGDSTNLLPSYAILSLLFLLVQLL